MDGGTVAVSPEYRFHVLCSRTVVCNCRNIATIVPLYHLLYYVPLNIFSW